MAPRNVALDVLRGIAIIGTLGTNIWIFTHVGGLLGYLGGPTTTGAWAAVQGLLMQLCQGKFLGLLTIMFGIGLAIQQNSARKRDAAWPGTYPWRAVLLFIDGVVHYFLVTEFDVLMAYAVTGLVVAYILATSARTQRRWLITATAVQVTLLTLVTVGLLASGNASSSGDPFPDEHRYADGSWWNLVQLRAELIVLFRLEAVVMLPLCVLLFLVGAALYRAGVLEPRGRTLRRRLIVIGVCAYPVDFVLELFGGTAGILLSRYGVAPLVALGLIGLVGTFYERRPLPGWVGRRLAEIGRTALSCYILQNLIASIICYGWGFGVAAQLSPSTVVPATIAVYLAIVVAIALAAHLWLRRFNRGPVEWLWNASYTRIARVQPAAAH